MIKYCVVAIISISFFCKPARAGDYTPDPKVAYTFEAVMEQLLSWSKKDEHWLNSLVINLRKSGSRPNFIYRFVRSSSKFKINGVIQSNLIFVSEKNPDIYLVADKNYALFVISFDSNKISAYGYGASLYISPSKNHCVVILSAPQWPPGGIPIDSGAPGNEPNFQGHIVSWH